MAHSLMVTGVLVVLVLPTLLYGRPAIDNSGSASGMLVARGAKSIEDPPSYEGNANSSLSQRITPITAKSRHKRLSDQRRAELETLMTLSKIRARLVTMLGNRQASRRPDTARIGRRRRFTTGPIPSVKSIPVRRRADGAERNRGGAYPLVS